MIELRRRAAALAFHDEVHAGVIAIALLQAPGDGPALNHSVASYDDALARVVLLGGEP